MSFLLDFFTLKRCVMKRGGSSVSLSLDNNEEKNKQKERSEPLLSSLQSVTDSDRGCEGSEKVKAQRK